MADDPAAVELPSIGLLLGRLSSAAQLSERVDALEDIKSLAATQQKEVGRVALPSLTDMLHAQPRDASVLKSALAVLDVLCRPGAGGESSTGVVNADFVLDGDGTVDSLLDLLAEPDMWVRLNAITLLSTLAAARPKRVGRVILECHAGMMKLMRILEDREEEVRNLLLVLLLSLTRSNVEVQNYCAFNECFDHFWGIMQQEGVWDGDAVVHDCLCILANIVARNEMTGKLFMLSRCGSELQQIVRPDPSRRAEHGDDWLVIARAQCVVAHLVRYNADNVTATGGDDMVCELRRRRVAQLAQIQSQLADSGYLVAICGVALDHVAAAVVVPLEDEVDVDAANAKARRSVEMQPAALRLLGNMVRGCARAQRLLNDDDATFAPQESMLRMPVASCLVQMSIDPTFKERVRDAAVFAFHAFLHGNADGVVKLLGHVIAPPPMMDDNGVDDAPPAQSSVKLLLDTLAAATSRVIDKALPVASGGSGEAAADTLVPLAWRSARLLEALLATGGETACEIGMRITMEEGEAQPQQLLTWLLRTLARSAARGTTAVRAAEQLRIVQISLLRLLIIWHWHSPRAVKQTLKSPANMFLFDMAAGAENAFGGALPAAGSTPGSSAAEAAHREQLVGLAVMLTGCFLEHSSDDDVPSGGDGEGGGIESARTRVLNMISRRVGFDRFSSALQRVIEGKFFVAANRLRFRSKAKVAPGSTTVVSGLVANVDEENASDGAVLGMDFTLLYDPQFTQLFRELRGKVNRTIIDAYTGGGKDKAGKGGDAAGLDMSLEPAVMAQMLQQYKEMIRMQDSELCELRAKLEATQDSKAEADEASAASSQVAAAEAAVAELQARCAELENCLAAARQRIELHAVSDAQGKADAAATADDDDTSAAALIKAAAVEAAEAAIAELQGRYVELEDDLAAARQRIELQIASDLKGKAATATLTRRCEAAEAALHEAQRSNAAEASGDAQMLAALTERASALKLQSDQSASELSVSQSRVVAITRELDELRAAAAGAAAGAAAATAAVAAVGLQPTATAAVGSISSVEAEAFALRIRDLESDASHDAAVHTAESDALRARIGELEAAVATSGAAASEREIESENESALAALTSKHAAAASESAAESDALRLRVEELESMAERSDDARRRETETLRLQVRELTADAAGSAAESATRSAATQAALRENIDALEIAARESSDAAQRSAAVQEARIVALTSDAGAAAARASELEARVAALTSDVDEAAAGADSVARELSLRVTKHEADLDALRAVAALRSGDEAAKASTVSLQLQRAQASVADAHAAAAAEKLKGADAEALAFRRNEELILLQEEHADLLVLLASQEMEKTALTLKLEEVGSAEAVEEALDLAAAALAQLAATTTTAAANAANLLATPGGGGGESVDLDGGVDEDDGEFTEMSL